MMEKVVELVVCARHSLHWSQVRFVHFEGMGDVEFVAGEECYQGSGGEAGFFIACIRKVKNVVKEKDVDVKVCLIHAMPL